MGAGIAQVAAAAGMRVTLVDVGEEQLERALDGHRRLAREARRRRASATTRTACSRASRPRPSLAGAADAELAIEAASEDVELKLAIFRQLDDALGAGRRAGVEHLVDPDRAAGGGHRAARAGLRHALHEPARADAAGRADPRPRDERRDRRDACARPPRPWARPWPRRATCPASWPTACCCRCSTRRPSASTRASATPRRSTPSCGSA